MGRWQQLALMGEGLLIWDDFLQWNTSTTSATSYQGGWTCVADNNPVFTQVAAPDVMGGEFGALNSNTLSSDNDEQYLTSSVTGCQFEIDVTTRKIAFEIRLKKSAVANDASTFYAGLASVGAAVAGTLAANAGTLIATKSFLGFNQKDTDGDAVNAVVQKASQTQQTPLSSAIALVADTYIKLGFVYEPSNATNCLRFYANGAEQVLSAKFVPVDLDDADFPNDVAMSVLFGSLYEGGGAETITIDWICAGQLI